MNILLLTDEMQIGGVSRHVVDVANGLYKKNIGVVVAANRGIMVKHLEPEIPFIELHIMSDGLRKKSILGFFNSLMVLRTLVKKYHITHIHTHKRYTDFIGSIISRLYGIKHVSTSHSIYITKIVINFFGSEIIAVSEAGKTNLEILFKKNSNTIKTIYNCLPSNIPTFKYSDSELREKYHLGKTDKLIVSIANFNTAKDYFTLIEAISQLAMKNKLHEVKFIFIGSGELEFKVHEMLSQLSLEKFVLLLNTQHNVNDFLHAAYCIVLSSHQEGFPYVMLEAAAHSKPMIATNIGGTSEFIDHNDNGLLVGAKQVTQLTDAIEYYLSNPSIVEEHGLRAHKKLVEHFDFDSFLSQIIDVYAKK